MAYFEKRSGGWRAQIRRVGADTISKSGFRTKAEAAEWAAQIEADIIAGRRGAIPNKTFGDLVQRYIEEVTPTKRSARHEAIRLNRIVGLGNKRDGSPKDPDKLALVQLQDLRPEHFAEWRDARLKAVSSPSVRRELNTLSSVCTVAVREWRWLRENPVKAIRKPEGKPPRFRTITADELSRILAACGYVAGEPVLTKQATVGAALLFALETAMRAGEICRVTDSDITGRVLHIPKTKNGSARDIPLSKKALAIIAQMPRGAHGEVFDITPASLDRLFRKARDRALVDGLHFHDSRRTALTRLAKKLNVMELARVSGHKDLRILNAVYFSPNIEDLADSMD